MDIRDTVKFGLFTHPTIFPEPLSVLIHLFCVVGNGYAWDKNGELADKCSKAVNVAKLKMKFSDLDADYLKLPEFEGLESLYDGRALAREASRIQRTFIEKNIERILNTSLVNDYFGNGITGPAYFTTHIATDYAKGIQFPDNITLDWGKVLYEFLQFWIYSLNSCYGVSSRGINDVSFWPEEAQKAYKDILAAKERLHPLINGDETYQEHIQKFSDLSHR